ncbi:MAG: glycosyltransferase family 39 protein [Thermoanaerobaculia bacterium]|nr:glycosyltransferase family 39 protein [Thermoanaerobaculia bacterium]
MGALASRARSVAKPLVAAGDGSVRHASVAVSLAVLFLLVYGVALGARDLWNPNEPLYGQVVREMAARSDWVVPTANGEVFAEKPVLYYWLALASSRALGGIDELSLRLPSALAGVAGVVLLYLLASRYVGRGQAALMACCLGTQYGYWFAARQVQMDVLLSVLVLATLLPLLRLLDHGARPAGAFAVAGLAAGGGFLAKGPLALLLPALVLTAYLGATRRPPDLGLWRPALAGVASFLLVAAPWTLLLWRTSPEGLSEMFLRQNVARFVEAWDHHQPWWYYLRYIWLELAPWSWIAPLGVGLAASSRDEDRLLRLASAWVVILVVFFSLSESKRSPYLLPAAPAVAILAGSVLHRWQWRRLGATRSKLTWGVVLTVVSVVAGAGAIVAAAGPGLLPEGGDRLPAAGVAIFVTALLAALFMARGRRSARAFALVLGLAGFYVLAGAGVLPAMNEVKSARAFGRHVQQKSEEGELASFGLLTQRAEYSYYGRTVVPNLATEAELSRFWQRPGPRFLIVEDDGLVRAREALGPVVELETARIGSRDVHLLAREERRAHPGGGDAGGE